jgi:hypothetical protein
MAVNDTAGACLQIEEATAAGGGITRSSHFG